MRIPGKRWQAGLVGRREGQIFVISGWLVVAMVLSGCQSPSAPAEPTRTVRDPLFTYSTFEGAIWQLDAAGQRDQLVAADGIMKHTLVWSEDHQWLAYVAEEYPAPSRTRVDSLFVVDRSGKNNKKLVGPAGQIPNVEWTDTRQLQVVAFDFGISVQTPVAEQSYATIEVNIETNSIRRLERPGGISTGSPFGVIVSRFGPFESPNGQWAVASRIEGAQQVFYLQDAQGRQVDRIFEQPANPPLLSLMWSPDGRWLVYSPAAFDTFLGDLYLYDPVGHSSRRLTSFYRGATVTFFISYLHWSPDSRWLVFATDGGGIPNQLCMVDVKRDPARCFDVRWKNNQFVWSGDSRFVAFIGGAGKDAASDIYVLEAAAGVVRNLTNNGNPEDEVWITAY